MAKKQGIKYQKGLTAAIKAARAQINRPLFVASNRRSIPMRHRALGELLSGPDSPGIPTGCFIEIIGQAHAGKTSLTFAIMDAVINQPIDKPIHRIQTDEGVEHIAPPTKVLFVDFEQTLDLNYLSNACRNIAILETDDDGNPTNMDQANVFVHQPMTLEEGCDLILHMIASQEVGLVIADSIAAMLSKEESDKSMGEMTVGKQARAVGAFLRKSAPMVNKYGVTVLLINQWRDKIGVAFGDPRTTPGGKAPAFYDAIRLDISGPQKTPWFTDGKIVKIKSMKNKVTGKKGEVVYHLSTGQGISAEVELTEMAMVAGILFNTSHKRPVKLKTKDGFKQYPNMEAWLKNLRDSPTLFDVVLKACIKRGVSSGNNIKADGNWEE